MSLGSGETCAIPLRLPLAELALVAADATWRVEPDAFDLAVAQSSQDAGLVATIEIDATTAARLSTAR